MRARRGKIGPGGVFVTGTDTGVGKTLVTAGILTAMRRQGLDAVPMKPVQTGCRAGRRGLQPPDLLVALKINALCPEADELERMCPCRFRTPCSPHLAARLEGGRVSIAAIRRAFEWLRARHEAVVVEGAGGVLVPLGPAGSTLRLMRRLDLPVVVVARAGLGTLNHTLLTLNEIRRAGLRIVGVVVNQPASHLWGRIEEDNVRSIRRLGRVRILAVIRHRRGVLVNSRAFQSRVVRVLAEIPWRGLIA